MTSNCWYYFLQISLLVQLISAAKCPSSFKWNSRLGQAYAQPVQADYSTWAIFQSRLIRFVLWPLISFVIFQNNFREAVFHFLSQLAFCRCWTVKAGIVSGECAERDSCSIHFILPVKVYEIMTLICLYYFLQIFLVLQLVSAAKCPSSFLCGNVGKIEFPFTTTERPDCGLLAVSGCDDQNPQANKTIELRKGLFYDVIASYDSTIVIRDFKLHKYLGSESCEAFERNLTLPSPSPLASFIIRSNITLFRCNRSLKIHFSKPFLNYTNCSDYNIFYACPNGFYCKDIEYPSSLAECSTIQLPTKDPTDSNHPFTFLTSEIHIQAQLSSDCEKCFRQEGD